MKLTRRRRAVGLGLAAMLVTLAVAGVAAASRPPIHPELRAMLFDASGRYYGHIPVNEPRNTPLKCFKGDISTKAKGSQWGAWTWSTYGVALAHEAQCHTANGISIEHKINGRWYVLWQGDEGYPPTHPLNEGSFTLQPVPRTVSKDLIRGLA